MNRSLQIGTLRRLRFSCTLLALLPLAVGCSRTATDPHDNSARSRNPAAPDRVEPTLVDYRWSTEPNSTRSCASSTAKSSSSTAGPPGACPASSSCPIRSQLAKEQATPASKSSPSTSTIRNRPSRVRNPGEVRRARRPPHQPANQIRRQQRIDGRLRNHQRRPAPLQTLRPHRANSATPSNSTPPPKRNSPPPTSTPRWRNCSPSDKHLGYAEPMPRSTETNRRRCATASLPSSDVLARSLRPEARSPTSTGKPSPSSNS